MFFITVEILTKKYIQVHMNNNKLVKKHPLIAVIFRGSEEGNLGYKHVVNYVHVYNTKKATYGKIKVS